MLRKNNRSVKWEDVIVTPQAGKANSSVVCRYCSAEWFNISVQRLNSHMLACKKLPDYLYERRGRDDGGWSPLKKKA
ncbi:hypothetical protein K469DRAFT_589953 [Zopfia rhizophila CBS 207.26]|uniref:BED-type domain-containing protein n=1 Tax=Zopfia rhizophila CBS 207.26 TaxID=1314779 RepID=A0A6A6DQW7_9PEZI|nr:hypothetical protein K469DRAFT_589953 [Zopfia rhizophila CBS 207.26]